LESLAQGKAISHYHEVDLIFLSRNEQNAAFLASQKSLDVVNAVSSALTNASYDKVGTQQVFIQSDDTSVLSAFKNNPSYKRVLSIEETISNVPRPSVDEIKKFADSVNVLRSSILMSRDSFLSSSSYVVNEMHEANITVYVSEFRNEFMTLAFDFYSDPIIELSTYITGIGVDGVVTEFPATASAYLSKNYAAPFIYSFFFFEKRYYASSIINLYKFALNQSFVCWNRHHHCAYI